MVCDLSKLKINTMKDKHDERSLEERLKDTYVHGIRIYVDYENDEVKADFGENEEDRFLSIEELDDLLTESIEKIFALNELKK